MMKKCISFFVSLKSKEIYLVLLSLAATWVVVNISGCASRPINGETWCEDHHCEQRPCRGNTRDDKKCLRPI